MHGVDGEESFARDACVDHAVEDAGGGFVGEAVAEPGAFECDACEAVDACGPAYIRGFEFVDDLAVVEEPCFVTGERL